MSKQGKQEGIQKGACDVAHMIYGITGIIGGIAFLFSLADHKWIIGIGFIIIGSIFVFVGYRSRKEISKRREQPCQPEEAQAEAEAKIEETYEWQPIDAYKQSSAELPIPYVKNKEDAILMMKFLSPFSVKERMTSEKIKTIALFGLAGIGVLGLLISLIQKASGIKMNSPEWLLVIPFSFALSAVCVSVSSKKANRKNESILSGEYFRGMSDEEIIAVANNDYIRIMNNSFINHRVIHLDAEERRRYDARNNDILTEYKRISRQRTDYAGET